MRWVARCAAMAILAAAGHAAAGPPSDELVGDEGEARKHYAQGSIDFDVGEFAAAAEEFKKAYQASAAPSLLFNLGQAQRLNRDYEPALFSYQAYLRLVPKAQNRGYVEARMADIGVVLRREEALAARDAAGTRRRPRLARSAKVEPALALEARPRPSGRLLMGIGIGGAAIGLAAVGIGAALGFAANAASGELTRYSQGGGAWGARELGIYQRQLALDTASTVMLVAGSVAAIGGAALWFFGWRREVARTVQVAVGVSPREAGLVVGWRF